MTSLKRLERRLAVVEIGATIGEQLQTMSSRLASLEAKIIRTPDASKALALSQTEMRAVLKRIEGAVGEISASWGAVLAAQDVIGQHLARSWLNPVPTRPAWISLPSS